MGLRYYTSRVRRRVDDPDAGVRQEVFLRAVRTLEPLVSIHYGHFQRNKVWRRRVDNPTKSVRVIDVKEKGSDVNIATHMIHDALSDACHMACVISSDSDLTEPIRMANDALRIGVKVFSPNTGNRSRQLEGISLSWSRIKDRTFRACHFPETLEDADGTITKPAAW